MRRSRRESRKGVNGGAALFQLLDWNRGVRRRKNLDALSLSSSASPPAEGVVHNRLAGDDKVPLAKLLQIAEEKCGTFRDRKDHPLAAYEPNNPGYSSSSVVNTAEDMKDERVRAAGLVARLMGLEFLPSLPPHSDIGESMVPGTHLDQELSGTRVPKVGSIKQCTDLPLRPQSLQNSEIILLSKPRQQQPQDKIDSLQHGSTSGCATKRCTISSNPSRRNVDGSTNFSFRKISSPIGRHLKPFSSPRDCNVAAKVKPYIRNAYLVDCECHFPADLNLARQQHSIYKANKMLSPCPPANGISNAEKCKPNSYLERNQLFSRSPYQLNCNQKGNMENKFSARVSLMQNHSLHDGEKTGLAKSDLCGIQRNGCHDGFDCFQQLNKTLDSSTNSRMSKRVEILEVNAGLKKKATHMRRSNDGYQVENHCSTIHKHAQIENDAMASRCIVLPGSPISTNCTHCLLRKETVQESNATYDTKIASNSIETRTAMKDQPSILPPREGKAHYMFLQTDSTSKQSQTPVSFTLMRDDLDALLVHKIKELNYADRYKKDRSSADILDELISAMTEREFDFPCHLIDNHCRETHASSYPMPEPDKLQTKVTNFKVEGGQYRSPLSNLEASFSTGSSVGESISITPAGKDDHSEMTCYSYYDDFLSNIYDVDLLDSASSTVSSNFSNDKTSHLLEGLLIMYQTNMCTLHEGEPCCATEVVSNVELILDKSQSSQKYNKEETSMDSLVLDTLETLVDACTVPGFNLASSDPLDKPLIRRFLFDFILEHLNLNYNYCSLSIYKGLVNVPLLLNCDKLSNEVLRKVQHWTNLAGFIGVESCLPLQLTDIEVESCIMVLEMEQKISEALINETIVDLLSESV